jgi:hypothetical protein
MARKTIGTIMKRILVITFTLLMGNSVYCQKITVWCERPEIEYNNHVGNEWAFGFKIYDKIYSIYQPIEIETNKVEIVFIVQEKDKYIEQGKDSFVINVSDLVKGTDYYKDLQITVVENGGRYKGNSALWHVRVLYKYE